jgi:3',5'-cyclic AMP phosphodiesterase CpdA
MLNILHISDLHFGPPYLPRIGDALLEFVPQLAADVIVVSGDLTQRAKPEQFKEAQAFLSRLPAVPRIVVPGNHDVPLYRIHERLSDPFSLYQQYISDQLDYSLRVDGATFVALNSTSPRRAISNGRIHRDQLQFCREAFRRAPPSDARIVVTHHHFCPAPDYERDQVMPRAKRAMNTFQELGVDLVLGGHLHRAFIGNSLDVYSGMDRNHDIVIVQCGTTTSRRGRGREREKNSFNLIRLNHDRMRVTHYMYFDQHESFSPISRHLFPRRGHTLAEDST